MVNPRLCETARLRDPCLKIGPRCGHVWLTSYPGPRGFSCLFAALVLSSYAEKNQENPLGPGVLNSLCFTYHWNPVDFPVCRFGYKKIDYYTISISLNIKENCWGSLTNCRGVTGDGLASRPGRVETLLAASCYRNGDKLRLL